MVVEDKIQEAKDCFDEITKTGYNSYQKFKYIEAKDLNPIVRKVCRKFKLRTNFQWDQEGNMIHLVITDMEDKSSYKASVPIAPVTAQDPGKYMQDIGRIQTYAMRYLYVQVFEIAVPDNIDNQPTKSKHKTSKKQDKKQEYPVKPIREEPTLEVTEQDVKEALDKVYEIIVEKGGAEFTIERAKFQLERQYHDKPQLVRACLNSLQMNNAQEEKKGL